MVLLPLHEALNPLCVDIVRILETGSGVSALYSDLLLTVFDFLVTLQSLSQETLLVLLLCDLVLLSGIFVGWLLLAYSQETLYRLLHLV